MDALTRAGELAAQRAEFLWKLDIIDPPVGSTDPRAKKSLEVINAIIDRNGWGVNVDYKGNGPPQWCGMFDGYCWSDAGLDPAWLVDYFASTLRLVSCWARYRKFKPTSKPNLPPTDANDRRLLVKLERGKPVKAEIRRGDMLIVGDGDPDEGDHASIVMGWDPVDRKFDTISGNGWGVGPHGDQREGISRRYYRVDVMSGYRAMWIIRPSFGDLLAERIDP